MLRLRLWALVCLFLSISAAARAQSAPAPTPNTMQVAFGKSVIALNGPWKFHIGDNPQWADPDFDDSKWETVDLTPPKGSFDPISGLPGYVPGWTAKGHKGYWGYGWYRLRLQVTGQPGTLAMAGPADVDDAYQLFANDKLVGSLGRFPNDRGAPVVYYSQPTMFHLSDLKAGGDRPATLVLAFRMWMQPGTLLAAPDAGGLHTPPALGETAAVTANYKLAWLVTIQGYITVLIEAALFLLLAAAIASLILFDRTDPVYWWLSGLFLLVSLERTAVCVASWSQLVGINAWVIGTDVVLHPLILGGWVMVWWAWFGLRRPAWLPKAIGLLTLLYMLSDALGEDIFYNVIPHPVASAIHLASVGIRLLFLVPLIFIVIGGVREQGREGLLALPAVLLVAIAQFQNELGVLHIRTVWFPFGQQITIAQVAYLTLAVVIFVLLLRRLLLSIRQQRQLALDVKQAQEVQHVLIPEELPSIPGLAIQSEYRPAREVGGDFFQIIPHRADGSVLVVAGDVTGKGLQAGMLVAVIVGTIRTAAENTFDPLDILHTLNRRLCGRGNAHATCLTLRIAADGGATLANAGHLPPYLNGKELPMEGAVPLGMISNADFSVMRFLLESSDRLMLLSDGVAEAQDDQGKLFGFDRVRSLLEKPITAAEIVAAAQAFGQQDDITVLSITRVPVLKEALA